MKKLKEKLILMSTVHRRITCKLAYLKHPLLHQSCQSIRWWDSGVTEPCQNLMMITIPINKMSGKNLIWFRITFNWLFDLSNHIKSKLATFKKVAHRFRPHHIICVIQHNLNMNNFILCYLECSNTKTNHKYEIRMKKYSKSTSSTLGVNG